MIVKINVVFLIIFISHFCQGDEMCLDEAKAVSVAFAEYSKNEMEYIKSNRKSIVVVYKKDKNNYYVTFTTKKKAIPRDLKGLEKALKNSRIGSGGLRSYVIDKKTFVIKKIYVAQ